MEKTTIKVSKETVKLINSLKIHPRQANEEIILKLIKEHKKGEKYK